MPQQNRLNMRLDPEHRSMLRDLQLLLSQPNLSETLRTIIRLQHTQLRAKVRQLRKAQQ
jgi:hypothetical protein